MDVAAVEPMCNYHVKKFNTFQYETFDTSVLFDGMRATDEDGEGAFSAQNNTTQGGF